MKALFLIFFCSLSSAMASEVIITKEFCDKYVIDHESAADVAYNPNDQKFGLPADINGSIQIQTPKEFKIPVQLDLARYLGVPPKVTDKNHKTLTSNLSTLNTLNNQLVASEAAVSAQQNSINIANTLIENQLTTPAPNTAALDAAFTQATTNIQSAIDALNLNKTRIQQSTGTVTANTNILKKQFNVYEQDAVVLDKNKAFKDSTAAALTTNQSHLNAANQQLSVLETSLNKNIENLNNSPLTYQANNTYGETLTDLQAKIASAKQNIAGLQTDQKQLTSLSKQVDALDNTKLKVLNNVDLGEVSVNMDGRIYFNGQPLFSQEEYRIKQACKQLRQK